MMDMVDIEQCDQYIDIKQSAHELERALPADSNSCFIAQPIDRFIADRRTSRTEGSKTKETGWAYGGRYRRSSQPLAGEY
jgi:hypothetical protein